MKYSSLVFNGIVFYMIMNSTLLLGSVAKAPAITPPGGPRISQAKVPLSDQEKKKPAFLRPGRFDRIIKFEKPDSDKQKAILGYYLSKVPHEHTQDPARTNALVNAVLLINETTQSHASPAVLKGIVDESARRTAHDVTLKAVPASTIIEVAREMLKNDAKQ